MRYRLFAGSCPVYGYVYYGLHSHCHTTLPSLYRCLRLDLPVTTLPTVTYLPHAPPFSFAHGCLTVPTHLILPHYMRLVARLDSCCRWMLRSVTAFRLCVTVPAVPHHTRFTHLRLVHYAPHTQFIAGYGLRLPHGLVRAFGCLVYRHGSRRRRTACHRSPLFSAVLRFVRFSLVGWFTFLPRAIRFYGLLLPYVLHTCIFGLHTHYAVRILRLHLCPFTHRCTATLRLHPAYYTLHPTVYAHYHGCLPHTGYRFGYLRVPFAVTAVHTLPCYTLRLDCLRITVLRFPHTLLRYFCARGLPPRCLRCAARWVRLRFCGYLRFTLPVCATTVCARGSTPMPVAVCVYCVPLTHTATFSCSAFYCTLLPLVACRFYSLPTAFLTRTSYRSVTTPTACHCVYCGWMHAYCLLLRWLHTPFCRCWFTHVLRFACGLPRTPPRLLPALLRFYAHTITAFAAFYCVTVYWFATYLLIPCYLVLCLPCRCRTPRFAYVRGCTHLLRGLRFGSLRFAFACGLRIATHGLRLVARLPLVCARRSTTRGSRSFWLIPPRFVAALVYTPGLRSHTTCLVCLRFAHHTRAVVRTYAFTPLPQFCLHSSFITYQFPTFATRLGYWIAVWFTRSPFTFAYHAQFLGFNTATYTTVARFMRGCAVPTVCVYRGSVCGYGSMPVRARTRRTGCVYRAPHATVYRLLRLLPVTVHTPPRTVYFSLLSAHRWRHPFATFTALPLRLLVTAHMPHTPRGSVLPLPGSYALRFTLFCLLVHCGPLVHPAVTVAGCCRTAFAPLPPRSFAVWLLVLVLIHGSAHAHSVHTPGFTAHAFTRFTAVHTRVTVYRHLPAHSHAYTFYAYSRIAAALPPRSSTVRVMVYVHGLVPHYSRLRCFCRFTTVYAHTPFHRTVTPRFSRSGLPVTRTLVRAFIYLPLRGLPRHRSRLRYIYHTRYLHLRLLLHCGSLVCYPVTLLHGYTLWLPLHPVCLTVGWLDYLLRFRRTTTFAVDSVWL